MWAVRRAYNPVKIQGHLVKAFQAHNIVSRIASNDSEALVGTSEASHFVSERCFPQKRIVSISEKVLLGSRGFSSFVDSHSSLDDSDDLEDGFSELGKARNNDITEDGKLGEENGDEVVSDPEKSNDDVEEPSDGELGLLHADTDKNDEKSEEKKNKYRTGLLMAILASSGQSVRVALDKWIEEGNVVGRTDVSVAMLNLRKRRMYGRALQLYEWLEDNKHLDFVERDYASRLDLVAKLYGLEKAEKYIEKIPKSFRGEVMYRNYLASCVEAGNLRKAEEVFNKMRDLNIPITAFACNQLLVLYKRLDKKKIANVLLIMENENIKPSLFTYKLLIDSKGESSDIKGMEQLVETMKAHGVEPDINTQAILARHYTSRGLKDKAETVLKEIEGSDLKGNREAVSNLLQLYAALGNADQVERLWKMCEPKPRVKECMAAIEAWGKLGKIKEAEAVFEKIRTTFNLSSKHYTALLKVYVNNKLVDKGMELVKRMGNSKCSIGPLTWDALVKLYLEAGQLEKADSILQKAQQQSHKKPLATSYMALMARYARNGDVHNAEKIFVRMKQSGYLPRMWYYSTLLQAYIKAKQPVYGFRERMMSDDIYPNKSLEAQLVKVDPFRKTALSELLE